MKSRSLTTVIYLAVILLILSVCRPVCTFGAEPEENGPDPDFHIYLAFGQSNMTGAAEIEPQDMVCDDDLWMMCTAGDFGGVYDGSVRAPGRWYKATPPLADSLIAKLGVADYFARGILEEKKEDNPDIRVGIIVVAIPGTGIRMFDKDAFPTYMESMLPQTRGTFAPLVAQYGQNPYRRLVDCARLAQRDGVIKGIIMHQGESDHMVPGWNDEVEKIYNDLVTDLELPDDTPFVAGEVRRNTIVTDMNMAVNRLTAQSESFHVVSTERLLPEDAEVDDGLHFTAEEYRILGKRYAKKMLEAERRRRIESDDTEDEPEYVVRNRTTDTLYRTVSEAFADADESRHNELVLLGDAQVSGGTLVNEKDLTLDMKGYSLDLKGHGILNTGRLSIVNTGGTKRKHYFVRDRDVWEASDRLSDNQKSHSYDIDSAGFPRDARYVRVKGSIIYNGGGTDERGGAITNMAAGGREAVLEVSNVGFVKCIAYNGGAIDNEGGTVTLNKVRAFGCMALRGGFFYNSEQGELTVDKARVKYCSAFDRGGVILNLGDADVNGMKVYSCEEGGAASDAGLR